MKKILIYVISLFVLLHAQSAHAGDVSNFDVYIGYTKSIELGKPVTLNIAAVDKVGNIIEDYTGSILVFSETDPKTILSSDFEYSVYEFTLDNRGVASLEEGVTFNSLGEQSLSVYDLNDETDSIFGIGEILVVEPEEIIETEFEFTIENDTNSNFLEQETSISQKMEYDDYINSTSTKYNSYELSFIDYLKSIIDEIEQGTYFPNDLAGERMDLEDRRYLMTFNGDDWAGIGGTLAWEGINPTEAYIIYNHITGLEGNDILNFQNGEHKPIIKDFLSIVEIPENTEEEEFIPVETIENEIISVDTSKETSEEVSKSSKIGDMIRTSFRSKREYNRGITRTVAVSDESSESLSLKDKVVNMIRTSFRKKREYNTGISRTVAVSDESSESLSLKDKVVNMIRTSFRKKTEYNTGMNRNSTEGEDVVADL